MRNKSLIQAKCDIRRSIFAERISCIFSASIFVAITLLLFCLAVPSANAQVVSMMGIDYTCQDFPTVVNLYLEDLGSGEFHTLKENCLQTRQGASLNSKQTMAVFGEYQLTDPDNAHVGYIQVYSLETKNLMTIRTVGGAGQAYFDSQDRIVFKENGLLKRMDASGNNVEILTPPDYPYRINMFWMSPDRQKIVMDEAMSSGPNYQTDLLSRLVLSNADGTEPVVLTDFFLGDWNNLTWKPDSKGFLIYYHGYNGFALDDFEEFPRYKVFDFSQRAIRINDLSNTDLGIEGNILMYTQCGSLLSITYPELYDAETGAFLSDTSSLVPPLTDTLIGSVDNVGISFANLDGSNFWQFECGVITTAIDIKPGSDSNCINLDSAGVIPVAILSSDTFDATQVDPATVTLSGASIKSVGKGDKLLSHYEDVNGDGLLDLVCQVLTEELSIESGQSTALIEAKTFDGISIRGEDNVCIVPSK